MTHIRAFPGDVLEPARHDRAPAHRSAGTRLLNALLTTRATTFWWLGFAGLLSVAILLRATAWIGLPAVATADTDSYCKVLHALEAGAIPDLSTRNIGYPLFMLACRAIPLPFHHALPLAQQSLAVAAGVIVTIWMRRRWGVLASLIAGGLLLVNAGHAVWAQYGQPNAMLYSVVPVALILSLAWLRDGRPAVLAWAVGLWAVPLMTRDELLLLALVPAAAVVAFHPPGRKRAAVWLVSIAGVTGIGVTVRVGCNSIATGHASHNTLGAAAFVWRTLHEPGLVAPPRPERLAEYYEAAAASGIASHWDRDGYIHMEGLRRVGQQQFNLSPHETIKDLTACGLECLRRRPGVYARAVGRDFLRLWLSPNPSMEWEAFRKSDPGIFARDGAKLAWATQASADFPTHYAGSTAQRLFHRLAVLRPGQYFAMKPLAVCCLMGIAALGLGVGTHPHTLPRWWFFGLAAGIAAMTLFYSAVADAIMRFRMSLDWAFFAVAALGIVLPLRFLQQRTARRDVQ